jgi:hypothetical protein
VDRTKRPPCFRRVTSRRRFADHLNAVLNRTVSDARLTLLPLPGEAEHFTIACLDGTRAVSFALHDSALRLLIALTVDVDRDKCHTVSYAYRLVTAEAKHAWLVRWEYFRRRPKPDYPYPFAHVHANVAFTNPTVADLLAKPASHLHVPTARLPLELVLWHVIAEWGVKPRSTNWQEILRESLAGYEQRRTAP